MQIHASQRRSIRNIKGNNHAIPLPLVARLEMTGAVYQDGIVRNRLLTLRRPIVVGGKPQRVLAIRQILKRLGSRIQGCGIVPSSTQVILPVPGLTPDFHAWWVT